jgi:osmotically-inducible protein OsmY
MQSDDDLKRDVEEELKFDPDIDPTDIAVSAKDGVVALTGFVRSYAQKWEAERDAKRVAGVRGVANDLEVRLPGVDQRPDPEIARDAVAALKRELPFSNQNLEVTVSNGWLTLDGETAWHFQKERAEAAVRHLKGLKGVSNLIHIKPQVAPSDVKRRIQEALTRSAATDANRIQGRGRRRQGHTERRSAVLRREGGGRAGGMVCAGRHHGRGRSRHRRLSSQLGLLAEAVRGREEMHESALPAGRRCSVRA